MPESTNNHTEEIKSSASGLFQSLRSFVREIFNVHGEVDKEGAAATIKKDIVFKGFNIWILILSIFICSIGLNLNSTAVIIGAMLISPLMGPITGIGFAVGTFDRDLLFLALKNLLVAVIISLLASFVFFSFAPISFDHSELDGRISPSVMDLFVALFGGFAGILAGTRGSKTNVIPGVAIATALMPPLCTAGYGLATGDMDYFLGASYLFFINSVFISLSALLVVRYLRFPIASYVNPKVLFRTKTGITIFVILVAVPSVFIYISAMKESIFKTEARSFINERINTDNHVVINPVLNYGDSINKIKLFVYGDEYSPSEKDSLTLLMNNYRLQNTQLEIHNMGTFDAFKSITQQKDEIIGEKQVLTDNMRLEIFRKHEINTQLESKIKHVTQSCEALDNIAVEANVLFPDLNSFDYAVKPLDDSLHSISLVVLVDWDKKLRGTNKQDQREKMNSWLNLKFEKQDSIRIVEIQ